MTRILETACGCSASFLSVNSKNGRGWLFDNLVVTTGGLGGDPYESATVRADKNRLYEYNLYWRKNDYFNPGLTTNGGQGQHLLDTSYTLQDHDLTLFPQSKIRFLLGYSRSAQGGAGISTVQLFSPAGPFDATGDIFPLFANVKISQNDYRLGAEAHWLGVTLNVLHGWEDFKDDSSSRFSGLTGGAIASGSTALTSFSRPQPYPGTSPYWRVGLFRNARWLDINGRFTYTGRVRAFLSSETAIGTNRFGALANQQIFSGGNARRPVATGNLNVTLLPTPKLTIATRTSVYNVRTEGNSSYLQYDNATQSADFLYFQYLGIRTVETGVDAQYQLRSWFDVHAGYAFSDRRIAASPQFAFAGRTSSAPYIQTNRLNSGLFGFQLRPLKGLTASIDGEFGRADRPFAPRSEQNYNSLGGRIQYKVKKLQFSIRTHADYNLNSVTLLTYSSHARTYSSSASWTPRSWLGFDAAYSKLHLNTLGGIAFFAGPQLFENQLSAYTSNIHSGTLLSRLSYKRVDFYFGYSHVQDTGDGRRTSAETIVGPNLVPFQTAQTFPLKFLSPSARLSARITERIRWNLGYQYFGYHEDFSAGENYIAHTGYTSILWSF